MERGQRRHGSESGRPMGRGECRRPEACPFQRGEGEEGFGPGRGPRMERGSGGPGREFGRGLGMPPGRPPRGADVDRDE